VSKNREIEIKIQIDEKTFKIAKTWLEKYAKYEGVLGQTDYYFNKPDAPFFFILPDGSKDSLEYLRVRVTDKKSYLCFKKVYRREDVSFYCDEYEVVIDDPEKTLSLFKAIGYTDVTVVEKSREIYRFDIFEVAIDTVKDLGVFIEVELKQPVPSVEAGHKLIRQFLKKIGIKSFEQHLQGYVRMLWKRDLSNSSGIAP